MALGLSGPFEQGGDDQMAWRKAPVRDAERAVENQPFSQNTVDKGARIKGATEVKSVCPYCAVGCAQNIYVKGGQIIDIEGNPDSPINGGKQCPKGSNTFQLTVNPHRVKTVMYRAPYSDRWETRSLDWAMDRIAQLTYETREEGFIEERDGTLLSHVTNMMSLGGATMDIEENYLIKKFFGAGLGMVAIENQARI
jgi:formate dehydrogenase major subunit